ncbi:MAG TPA: N-acetylmuramoyl-L-alanine amidase [bacterium]|nr:N-acetylmuramoyl-L-alanine amidase [bacterium]HPG45050.1 N-acetylmuramoyl-L-alanine amidase [bacterium]HPM97292.1 N-acetylmuramoyl-L-alanine amidase [bacterium]
MRHTLLLLITLAALSSLHAQNIRRSLPLQMTFPSFGDTLDVDKLRISGYTDPSAKVTINRDQVRVYSSGAFVARVDLQLGWNTIRVQARLSNQTRDDSLRIYRPAPIEATPIFPTSFDSRFFSPDSDIWLCDGDVLHVRCKGSPGGHARFSIEGLIKDVPMVETEMSPEFPWPGLYHGLVRLDNKVTGKKLQIHIELKGMDGRTVKQTLPSQLYVMSDKLPLIGQTIAATDLWNDTEQGIRMGKLSPFVRIHVVGKIGHRYKIRLSPSHVGYVASDQVQLLSAGEALSDTWINAVRIAFDRKKLQLIFDAGRAVPAIVRQIVEPAGLDLYLFNSRLQSESIAWPNSETELKHLAVEQVADGVVKIHADLTDGQQWGYGLEFEANRLVWTIKRPLQLALSGARPLEGLVVCVDPGHGGDENGAMGPAGTREKEINLRFAQVFAEQLTSAGSRVVLTRTDDRNLGLQERIDFARQSNSDLFISVHHNSIAASIDPLRVRGAGVYFYQPQSQALAWTLYPYLTRQGLDFFGRFQTSFAVLRLTEMPAILIECAFLSHPEEEILLNDDRFSQRLAANYVEGIIEFLRQAKR